MKTDTCKYRFIALWLVVSSFLLCFSCKDEKEDINIPDKEKSNGKIAFYEAALKDSSILIHKAELDDYHLTERPWFTAGDIEIYDFSTHMVYLKKDIQHYPFWHEELLFTTKTIILTVDGNKKYEMFIWPLHFSSLPPGPRVDFYPFFEPGDMFRIALEFAVFGQNEHDPRNDPAIKEALISEELYHAGIECSLNMVDIKKKTVNYAFSVKNNDVDPLYLLDPQKAGDDIFHYYSYGLHLMDTVRNQYYYPVYNDIAPEPPDEINISWFSRVKPGGEMQGSVTMEVAEEVKSGEYICLFYYSSPSFIDKQTRLRADGRIWMGKVPAKPVYINK